MAYRIRDATKVGVATKRKSRPCGCGDVSCDCAVCRTLVCSERPRYFAGQLLTERELNSEQAYILNKQRLHNRFLHGTGVVCGLEVVCHECDGWVTVQPGYAIDPCGNDIVVCESHDFDVLDAIRRCKQVERQRGDCEPYRSTVSQRCDDDVEHWCLTIRYKEQEARPTTPLLNGRACTCGGSHNGGSSCGCGGSHSNGSSRKQCSCGGSSTINGCEPTRILESYQLEMICQPDHCARGLRELLDNRDLSSPIVRCLTNFRTYYSEQVRQEKINQSDLATILQVAFIAQMPDLPANEIPVLNQLCGRFWCFVYALFRSNPLGSPINNCAIFQTLDSLVCPVPPPVGNEGSGSVEYFRALQSNFRSLLDLVFEYLMDCICHHLLPTCAAEPCDDRLILACIEVRDGKIVRIGNFCCRQFAGSFPAVAHWLSLIPGLTFVVDLVKSLCCDPDISDFIFQRASTYDPAGVFVNRFSANNFSVPRAYWSTFSDRSASIFRGIFNLDANTPGTVTPGSVVTPINVGASVASDVALRVEMDDLRREITALRAEVARLNPG